MNARRNFGDAIVGDKKGMIAKRDKPVVANVGGRGRVSQNGGIVEEDGGVCGFRRLGRRH